jgi:hypothetical protein
MASGSLGLLLFVMRKFSQGENKTISTPGAGNPLEKLFHTFLHPMGVDRNKVENERRMLLVQILELCEPLGLSSSLIFTNAPHENCIQYIAMPAAYAWMLL